MAFAIVAILNMWLILASNLATTCISVTIHCGFYVLDHLASRAADSQNLEDGSARKKPQSKQSHNKMRQIQALRSGGGSRMGQQHALLILRVFNTYVDIMSVLQIQTSTVHSFDGCEKLKQTYRLNPVIYSSSCTICDM